MRVYFDNDAGHWQWDITDHIFAHTRCEWRQLFRWRQYNWIDWHFIHIYFMADGAAPGYEFEVIVMGLGFRLRINKDWEGTEFGKRLAEAKEYAARLSTGDDGNDGDGECAADVSEVP